MTALQFCYVFRSLELGTSRVDILRFYTLEQGVNTSTFRITGIVDVSSLPTSEICTGVQEVGLSYCCDTQKLDASDFFPLPAQNFAFGFDVTANTRVADLLSFGSSSSLRVDHFNFDPLITPVPQTVGSNFTHEGSLSSEKALRLFNLVICKYNNVSY